MAILLSALARPRIHVCISAKLKWGVFFVLGFIFALSWYGFLTWVAWNIIVAGKRAVLG